MTSKKEKFSHLLGLNEMINLRLVWCNNSLKRNRTNHWRIAKQ